MEEAMKEACDLKAFRKVKCFLYCDKDSLNINLTNDKEYLVEDEKIDSYLITNDVGKKTWIDNCYFNEVPISDMREIGEFDENFYIRLACKDKFMRNVDVREVIFFDIWMEWLNLTGVKKDKNNPIDTSLSKLLKHLKYKKIISNYHLSKSKEVSVEFPNGDVELF